MCADLIPIQLATASVNIDLGYLQPASPLPGVSAEPEGYDNGKGEVGLEEALGIVEARFTRRCNGREELKISVSFKVDFTHGER